eukprot:PhF_6_TR24435/c0_g1_i1/m.33792
MCHQCISGSDPVSFQQLYDLLHKKRNHVCLVDVRDFNETACGTIEYAHKIPLPELSEALNLEPQEFQKKYRFPKPSKEDPNVLIVTYCWDGTRGEVGASMFSALGYQSVLCYYGGLLEWNHRQSQL